MDGATPLGKLLENGGRYVVPYYQRGYSWKTKQIEEFLRDLSRTADSGKHVYTHFFGTMLTTDPTVSDRQSMIIDGQQRMSTAVLFLLCARNFFHRYKDAYPSAKQHYKFVEKHIYPTHNGTPTNPPESILTLSAPNRDFFQDILDHKSMADELPQIHITNDSNKLLNAAYIKIRDCFTDKSPKTLKLDKMPDIESKINAIHGYVITLFEKFTIFNIKCDDEYEAQQIFNLVNNRGIGLSSSDLIKNLLFSTLSDNITPTKVIESLDKIWTDMRNHVTSKRHADYTLDRFFHHYLLVFYSETLAKITKNPDRIQPNEIYDSYDSLLKNNVSQPDKIIKNLRDWSYVLERLRRPTGADFHYNDNVTHYLKKVKNLNAVTVYPGIMAGYEKYLKNENRKPFEALVMLCFKYHLRIKTIGTAFTIGEYQDAMHTIMKSINQGTAMSEIIDELSNNRLLYPDKSVVESTLRQYRVTNSQQALAILEEAESTLNKKRSPLDTSIEHIMPITLNSWWISYIIDNNPNVNSEQDARKFHKQNVHLLGNQTLLSGKINNPLGNKSYESKSEAYKNDKTFKMNEIFAQYPVWNLENMLKRQTTLAKDIIKAIDINKIPATVNLR